MSFGKMNGFADIVKTRQVKDSEGFTHTEDEAFSEATELFRFRRIPGLTVTTDHVLITEGDRYDIVSVENVKGRGMYIEVLAKRSEPTVGKS